MKKNLLIVTILGALTASSFGQGQIGFVAGGGKIKYSTDNGTTLVNVPTGNPDNVPGYGQVNLAFYSASAGTVLGTTSTAYGALTPDFTGWTIQTSALFRSVLPTAGSISSGTAILAASSGAPAVNAQIEIVAWTGNFTTFAQALAAGTGLIGWTGSALSGGAFGWSNPTGDGNTIVASTTTGAGGFNGIVMLTPVPEPGTIVLGGLGAAALLLFRRRK